MASIAHRYNISVSTLKAYNNLSSKKGPRVGQSLKVPVRTIRYAKGSSSQQPERDKIQANGNGQIIRYKVKKGDSLSSLAQRFNTTSSEIKRMNRIKGNSVQTGRIIKIVGQGGASEAEPERSESTEKKTTLKKKKSVPKDVASEPAGSVYTVKKGDSLDKIARKKNISLARLLELNKLDRNDSIHPGQAIVLK
jgi:LysM repeat protein